MNLPVVWSPVAKDEYADLLEFIENNYGVDAALRVLDKTEAVIGKYFPIPQNVSFLLLAKGCAKSSPFKTNLPSLQSITF